MDSQCERIGEALIRALRGDIRLLTLLKSELDAELDWSSSTTATVREERERRRRRRGLWFFGGGKGR